MKEYPEIKNENVDADFWSLIEEGITSLDCAEEGKLTQLFVDPDAIVAEKSDRENIPVAEQEDEGGVKTDVSHIGYTCEQGDAESEAELAKYPRFKPFLDRLPNGTIKINDESPVDLEQPDLMMLLARVYGSGSLKPGQVLREGVQAPVK